MTTATVAGSTMPLWYATRASGVIALVLLTGSVVLGIVVKVRFATERWPRLVTMGMHRSVSLLVLAFLGVHIATAVLDSYAPVGWLSILVPFASAYRPLWLGLGTVAFDLLIAVTVTSLLRTRISVRLWRLVHWAAYGCWPVAVLHGLGTGSDAKQPFVLGLTVACVAAVLLAGFWRLASGWPGHAAARLSAGATAVLVLLAAFAWTVSGPLRPGWAARAGTPAALLARANPTATVAAQPNQTSTQTRLPVLPFSTAVSGTVSTARSASGSSDVTIAGLGSDPVAFRVVITGSAAEEGGVVMTSSHVTFGPSASPQQYSGQVTALNGTHLQASVTDSAGAAVALTFDLKLTETAMSGTLTAAPA